MKKILCLVVASICVASCGPEPTVGDYTNQRKVNFFKILAYERFQTQFADVEVILFEDQAGNCYITSGVDGGIQNAPKSACEQAKITFVESPVSGFVESPVSK